MRTFLHLTYHLLAALYETVPAFVDIWTECLGDLGRYRMAIEDDITVRQQWNEVASSWYFKAADRKPTVGRLYHHIALLAGPHDKLFFYCKSLIVGKPFMARESILSLFVSSNKPTAAACSSLVDVNFVTLHGIWFTHTDLDRFDGVLDEYISLLNKHISKSDKMLAAAGCQIAVCNIAALCQYNSQTGKLRQAWKDGIVAIKDEEMQGSPELNIDEATSNRDIEHASLLATASVAIKEEAGNENSWPPLEYAIKMSFSILKLFLQIDNNHVLPHVHTWMVFLYHITKAVPAMRLIEQEFPFQNLTTLLNSLIKAKSESPFELDEFPKRQGRPLPEDWTLRGLEFTSDYFPPGWIEDAMVDDEERLLELPSFLAARKQRILWLGYMIVKAGDWLSYNPKTQSFSVHPGVHAEEK